MLDTSWKWKLTDKRTQERYVEKGILDKAEAEKSVASLPDLSAQAVCVEIAMDDCSMEGNPSQSDASANSGNLT